MVDMKTMIQINNIDKQPKRCLVLGSTGYQGVDSTQWDDKLPNIVDYDVVVVDVRSLDDNKLKKISHERFKDIRIQLIRLLDSKGQIVILTDVQQTIKRPKGYPDIISNYDWCPIMIGLSGESGETIIIKQACFPMYLKSLKDWTYYVFIPDNCLSSELTNYYGSTHNTKYAIPCTPFLTNRYDKVLAGSYKIEVRNQIIEPGYFSGNTTYPKAPHHVTGDIILLPLLPAIDAKHAVSLVLQDLIGLAPEAEPPEWTGSISFPKIAEIEAEISKRRKDIGSIFDEIEKMEAQRRSLEEYKKLLYASGSELEEIVKKAFLELGSDVMPAKYGQEEFVLEVANAEHLVEIKGVAKSISLTNLRQLTDYLLK